MSSLGYGAAQCIIHISVGSMSVMEGGYQNYLAAKITAKYNLSH